MNWYKTPDQTTLDKVISDLEILLIYSDKELRVKTVNSVTRILREAEDKRKVIMIEGIIDEFSDEDKACDEIDEIIDRDITIDNIEMYKDLVRRVLRPVTDPKDHARIVRIINGCELKDLVD